MVLNLFCAFRRKPRAWHETNECVTVQVRSRQLALPNCEIKSEDKRVLDVKATATASNDNCVITWPESKYYYGYTTDQIGSDTSEVWRPTRHIIGHLVDEGPDTTRTMSLHEDLQVAQLPLSDSMHSRLRKKSHSFHP